MDSLARRVFRPIMAVLILASVVLAGPVAPADAAYRSFGAPRFSTTEPGDIIMAANTLLTCPASTACTDTQNGFGPATANNDFNMIRVDIDDSLGLDPLSQTNISSAADLNMPPGAQVKFAGLYWGAVSNNAANRQNVRFSTPASGGYLNLAASQVDDNNGGTTYQSFLDVTTLVQTAGSGQYVVGGIEAQTGGGRHAGWSLVVVYGDTNQPYRNLTVFDGFQRVTTGNPINITVSGFLTPPSGPVTGQIGFVTYEGDDRFVGDFAQLNGQQLNDSANPATNFFNSAISDSGVLITTKNPNYVDQLGFDATITNTVGVIPAGATSATITMDSAGDWYYPGVVTAAIDVYVPNLVLDLSKTVTDDNGGSVNPGDVLTYEVTFSNQGDDAGLDVTLSDQIPANTSYLPGSMEVLTGENPGAKTDAAGDDTAFFDGSGNQVVLYLGASATPTAGGRVAPFATTGTTYNLRFKVQVDPGTEGLTAINEAFLAYTGETIPDSYSAATNETVSDIVALADVKLTGKSDSQDPVLAGDSLSWTIDAANDGPSTADNVVITDTLPAGLIFDPGSSDPRCGETGGVVTCAIGSMGSSTTDSVTIGVDVPPSMAGGTFTNTAQISTSTQDRSTADDLATEQTTVERLVDLEVTKTETPNPLSPPDAAIAGEQIDYLITVTNNGPATASNVVLTDLLPAGTTVGSTSSGGSCTTTAGTIECTWAAIGVGASETLAVSINLDPNQANGSTLANSAAASADEPESAVGQPNSASVNTPIATSADLSLIKSTTDSAVAGSTMTWDLLASNAGPSHAKNVTVSDPLPVGATFVVGLSSSACSESGGVVTCTIPQIDSGNSTAFAIGVRISPTATQGATLTNTASVASDTSDPDGSNNSTSDSVTVDRVSNLSIVKSGPGTISAGGQIEYTLTVNNAGPSAAANVQVNDTLPSELVFVSAPGCSGTTAITCDLPSLAAGGSTTFTITADVPGTVADGLDLVNTASITSDETDPNPSNNSSQLTTTTDRTAALELTKTESAGVPDPVLAGTPVSWDITLTNLSASSDSNVVISDDLAGQPVVGPITAAISGTPGSCTVTGLSVSCSVPTLPGNASAVIVISGIADPSAVSGDVINNIANAVGDFSSPVTGIEETTINAESDLTVSKTGPAELIAGQTGVWTLVLTNDGPAQAKSVQMTDLLPTGVTYISSSATPGSVTCTPVGANVSCPVGTLDPGASVSIDVTARVERNSPAGTVANSAVAASDTADPDPASNEGSVTTTITRSADIEFTKTATTPSTNAGDTVSFALTANNLGPSLATNVVITDTIDPAFVFNPALSDASCSQTGATVTCNLGDLDPQSAATTANITFDVDAAQLPGTYTNNASVTATETDPDPANNSDSADFVVDSVADLSVAKTSPPSPAVPGETYTYTLEVANNGPSDALANTVTDTLPSGTSLAPGSSATCSESPPGTVTCSIADLAPTDSALLTIVVDIDPALTGTLTNTATVSGATVDPDTPNNQSTDVTPLIPSADLQLTKTAPTDTNAGGTITWSLVLANAGPSVATSSEITDVLPSQVTFSAASNPLCTAVGSNVTCSVGDIAPGASISVDIVANVNVSAVEGSLLTNSADADSAVADSDTTNNSDSVSSRVRRSADIGLTKTATSAAVAGGTVTYDLTLTNNGPSTASAVSFTDTFVSELTPTTATPAGGGACSISGQTVTCSASELLPGQTVDATIEALVDSGANAGDVITNTASSSAAEPDPSAGNNSASESITVEREANLALIKSASQPTGLAGEAVTWDLLVRNFGPSDATGVTVTDVLGSDRTFDPAGSSPTCSLSGNTVSCTEPSLAESASVTFTISTILSSALAEGATVSNTATVASNETDFDLADNTSSASMTVTTSADLSITKDSPAAPVVPGTTVLWPVSIENLGPSDATTVVVSDTLPPGTTFNAAQSSASCALVSPGIVECSLPSIASGSTASLTVAADVGSSRIGSLDNSASVSSATSDPAAANDSDSSSDALTPTADIALTKTALTDPVVAGQDAQWEIEVANIGPSDASGVELLDVLGDDLTYVDSASDSRCDPAGSDIACTVGILQAGTSTTLTVTSTLGTSLGDGASVTNQVSVTSASTDPDGSNDTANASATVTRQADLGITKTSSTGSVNAGDVAIWNIVVVNNGPSDASSIVATDNLPPGATFDAASSTASCSVTGGVISCPVADLVDGSGANLTIGMRLPSDLSAGSSATNTASVNGAAPDPDGTNNSSSASVSITREADLSVAKRQPAAPPVPGQSTTWAVEVSNLGPSDASTIVVTDTLPATVIFDAVGSDPSCSETTPGNVVCSIASVVAGATATVLIAAEVPPGATADLSNAAQATAAESDPDTSNNTDSVVTAVDPQADISTLKTVITSPIVAGEVVLWNIEVTNDGPSDAVGVTTTDAFGSTMTFNAPASDSFCSQSGFVVVCDHGSIGAGSTSTATVAFDLDATTPAGSTLNNSASTSSGTNDPDATNNSSTASGPVTQSSDLVVTKLANDSVAVAGQDTSFQVVVDNAGPSDAANVVITDAIPSGTTFNAADSDSSCTQSGGSISCTISAISAGGSASVRVSVNVDPTFADASVLTNSASATSDQPDPDASNNTGSASITVERSANLRVTKSLNGQAVPGALAQWTIDAANLGPSEATGVTVTDTLDPRVTFAPGASSPGCLETTPGTITCTIGTVALNSSSSVVIGAVIDSDALGTLSNAASITGNETDPDSTNDTTAVTDPLSPAADLVVTKTLDSSPAFAGGQALWTVTVENLGPSDARNVAISDVADSFASFDSSSSDPRCTDGTPVTCTTTAIAVGQTQSFVIGFTVDEATADGSQLNNTATATAATPDPDSSNSQATATGTVATSADLSLSKFSLTPSPVVGETTTWQLSVNNPGPSVATDVLVSDPVPSGLSFNAGASDPACTLNGSVVECAYSALASGTTTTANVSFDIDPNVSDGAAITNAGSVAATTSDPDPTNNSASNTITAERSADMRLQKTHSGPATAGGLTTWVLIITNLGPSDATSTVATDTLPPGATLDSAGSDPSCIESSPGNVTCNVGDLANGAGTSVTVVAAIDPATTGQITNSASIAGAESDPDPTNNSDSSSVDTDSAADLDVTKSLVTLNPTPGQPVEWLVSVANLGPSNADDVQIADSFGTDLQFNAAGSDARCALDAPGSVICSVGGLVVGASSDLSLLFDSSPSIVDGASISNNATASATTPDPDTANNSDTSQATFIRDSDLSVTKVGPGAVVAGEPVSFDLSVTNNGPSAANNVVLTDALPPSISAVSVTGDPSCALTGNTVSCSPAVMAPGEVILLTVNGVVSSGSADGSTIDNSAFAASDSADSNNANDTATTSAAVTRGVDLELTKTLLGAIVAGREVLWELSVTNNGPSDASGLVLTDTLPAGLTFRPDLSSAGCSAGVTCTVGLLPAGQSITVVIGSDADPGLALGDTLTNTAEATSSEAETNPASNQASASGTVVRETDLSILKQGPSAPITAGTSFIWTIDIANDGPSDGSGVVAVDTLPAGTTFDPANSDSRCSAAGDTVTCTIGTFVVGTTDTVSIGVDVASSVANGDTLTNMVAVNADQGDPDPADNTSAHTVDIARTSGLTLAKVDLADPVIAGEQVSWSIEVGNPFGPSDTDNVIVTDTLPAGVTFDPVGSDPACTLEVDGTISCAVGTVPAGSATTILIVGDLDPALPDGTLLDNEVTATGDGATAVSTNEETTVRREADLSVTKASSTATVTPGEPLSYEITVTNNGPSNASNVSVLDALPPGSVVDAVDPAADCSFTAGSVICNLASLSAGASQVITIDLTPEPWLADGSNFDNGAVASSDEPDPNGGNDSGQADTPVERLVDVSITKTPSSPNANAGDSLTYDIVAANAGPSDANGLTVVDVLATGVSFNPGLSSPGCSLSGSTVSCPLPAVAAGASGSVSVGVDINPATTGTITNNASITTLETNSNPDPTASAEVVVSELADLTLTKTAASTIVAGEILSFTFQVTNNGPGLARSVVVTDILPPELGVNSLPVGCTAADQTVICTLGDMAVGQAANLTVETIVDPGAGQSIANTASVTSDASETSPLDNVDSTSTTVSRITDLALSKSAVSVDVVAGGQVMWLIEVLNQGPSQATDVIVADALAESLTFDPDLSSPGCQLTEQTLACSLADIAPGETATLTLATDIANDAFGLLTNTASAQSGQDDPNPASATANAVVEVRRPDAELNVTKTGSKSSLKAGDLVTWTIAINNGGSEPILSTIQVTDSIPAGHELVSIVPGSPTCVESSGVIDCELSGLGAGESIDLVLRTRVVQDQKQAINTVLVSASGIAGGEEPDGAVTATATAQINASAGLAFTGGSLRLMLTIAFGLFLLGYFFLIVGKRREEDPEDPENPARPHQDGDTSKDVRLPAD